MAVLHSSSPAAHKNIEPCTHARANNVKRKDLKISRTRNGRCGATFLVAGPSTSPRCAFMRGFQAGWEARARPLKGLRHRTHLENVKRGCLDRLSPREERGVAFIGEIALLASPPSTLASRKPRAKKQKVEIPETVEITAVP